MSSFQDQRSLYVSDKKELSRVLTWMGAIIFWLTFWLPSGIFLGGNSTALGAYFPEMEVVLPISFVGILIVLGAKFLDKSLDKEYFAKFLNGAKTATLWLVIIAIISFFSREFHTSILFIPIFLAGMFTISLGKDLSPHNVYKNSLIAAGILTGFIISYMSPELHISGDLLALVSVLGLAFLSDLVTPFSLERMRRNAKSREIWVRLAMQIVYLFVVFQSDNMIFQLLSLVILFFSGKVFVYRRGRLSPDILGIIIFAGLFLVRMYYHGIYTILIPSVVPHFWSNFREILLGVGQGQFLTALQKSSDFLLPLAELQIPGSGLLLTLFEQGILGVFAMVLLFIFSHYLRPKRSFIYLFLIVFLWIFSSAFSVSESGIILLMFFLFLNTDKEISRDSSS